MINCQTGNPLNHVGGGINLNNTKSITHINHHCTNAWKLNHSSVNLTASMPDTYLNAATSVAVGEADAVRQADRDMSRWSRTTNGSVSVNISSAGRKFSTLSTEAKHVQSRAKIFLTNIFKKTVSVASHKEMNPASPESGSNSGTISSEMSSGSVVSERSSATTYSVQKLRNRLDKKSSKISFNSSDNKSVRNPDKKYNITSPVHRENSLLIEPSSKETTSAAIWNSAFIHPRVVPLVSDTYNDINKLKIG